MVLDPIAKALIILGACLILSGIAWQLEWIQTLKFGRLPGDIIIERKNISLYFPLTTGLLVSGLISLIVRLFRLN